MTIVELSTFRGQASSSLAGTAIKSSPVSLLRPDCVAGHVGLELRNVDANYPFERSHRFPLIEPNSGFGDYSCLSCGVGDTQLRRRPGSRRGCTSRARAASQDPSRIPARETTRVLSCSAGDKQLGAGFCRDLQQAFRPYKNREHRSVSRDRDRRCACV